MQNKIRILGLDVSKSSVSACLLESKPDRVRQFYYEYRFLKFNANRAGITAMLALNADIAIIEPTGTNYSLIWAEHLRRAGVDVLSVGHKELRNYRANHLALPDKDDDADSLALACYWFDYCGDTTRFVDNRCGIIRHIRRLILRLSHLNRVQSPIVNRLRQDLAWQFPEIALSQSKPGKCGVSPLWAWLAGEAVSLRYDAMLANSIGLGIGHEVKFHAQRLCSLQREERLIELELQQLLSDERFSVYREAFAKFGFGLRLQAMILSQIYPIEFFLKDGKPEVQIRKGRKSGKPTKRYISLRKFQKCLGLAPSLESSGDKHQSKVNSGSKLCRKAFWQWVFTRLEVKRCRLDNEIYTTLCEFLDSEKTLGKPIRLVRSRVASKAVKLLFRELTSDQ
ncbi:transposase [Calothrix sp. FACHB-1219]|uniref:IS110 family transposase n=1 Tax=unclassified Calothrix TaxID=2619626 RepID=UPI00168902DE|nr:MULTISPECIES: transposase [unclassified Calothrix]MBD2204960.1 transposase [Calothrix sp. FACHB-168]MBD2216216.1 transposase [Calothrix sp. FACHB-1219]